MKKLYRAIDPLITLGFQDPYPFCSLDISPYLSKKEPSENIQIHMYEVEILLKHMIPLEILSHRQPEKGFLQWANTHLPLITKSECEQKPDYLSFYLFCNSTPSLQTQQLFQTSLLKSLIQTEALSSFQHLYFHLPELSSHSFLFTEVRTLIQKEEDHSLIENNFSSFKDQFTETYLKSR